MTQEEQRYVSDIINYFWGEGTAKPSQINQRVARLAHEALAEAGKCTGNMDLVPRPPQARPSLKYVITQFRKILTRIAEEEREIYQLCRQRVQINSKSSMRLALMGL
ncbi:hypothetical protein [Marinobacter sp. AN1]|uniref:hypothetical protein n=1 Tax=Marinobacter sp. AN1 TaxID=2886046 RepID=UPI00222EB003|nr:hypothetical protein [Marinobacter sp. AN1]UZD67251.1 hypothetical protein LJ360_08030 [Marinobacter sp. AN1]